MDRRKMSFAGALARWLGPVCKPVYAMQTKTALIPACTSCKIESSLSSANTIVRLAFSYSWGKKKIPVMNVPIHRKLNTIPAAM